MYITTDGVKSFLNAKIDQINSWPEESRNYEEKAKLNWLLDLLEEYERSEI